jgi:eukaryotic-like serine/threonine-protein kinase
MTGSQGLSDPEGRGDHPARFGLYRVQEIIGTGGMGIVYRALDEALERQVALKTLAPALAVDPEFVARFKREAQSAAALNHPNITQIYTIGQEGTVPFFAMELIEGPSLEKLVRDRGALDTFTAARYIVQAAQGLRHAHQRQLIHRDIKPSNLMLTGEGIIKITDFGLAKAARSETKLTATGEVLGSPGYISPEQAQGGSIDARSDIYSLGATFYHLVTGKLPFDAPTPVAMIIKHMNEPLRSPRALNPSIPYPIAAIIQKMMAKRPGERFQDYDALLRELERALAGAPAANDARGVSTGPATSADTRPGATVARTAAAGTAGRPVRSTAPPLAAADDTGSAAWLPKALAVLVVALVLIGLVQHLRSVGEGSSAGLQPDRTRADGAGRSPGAAPLQAQGSFTTRPALGGLVTDSTRDGRSSAGPPADNRPDLFFLSSDHEVLADGRLKVMGRIQNRGTGTAGQVRVRIVVMLANDTIVARAEIPLAPPTVPPGGTASFEVPIDYTGPVGRIKAELVWVD